MSEENGPEQQGQQAGEAPSRPSRTPVAGRARSGEAARSVSPSDGRHAGAALLPRFDALGRPWRHDLRVLLPGDPSPLRLRLAPLSFHLVPKHPPIRSPPPGRRDVELVSQESAAVLMVSV